MDSALFHEFVSSSDTLRVYEADKPIFTSNKDRLVPLLEYLASPIFNYQPVTIFDKVVGNAAALLAVKANCREIYSPLGSEVAIKTLNKYGIRYHFTDVVPYIQQPDGKGICPMEKLSIDKEPEEFYKAISALLITQNTERASGRETPWTR